MPNILVVEGNAQSTTDTMVSMGARPYSESYAALLESFSTDIHCTIAYPAEKGPDCLPANTTLSDFEGIAWTGSALSVYADQPEVARQVAFAKRCAEAGVPVFGSCWGLQVMTVTLGGKVQKNTKGREIGIGRDITLTTAGRIHPLFAGKGPVFDALQVHGDEVHCLPPNAVVLASNAMSEVQAMVVETEEVSFWGVQYHPEFHFNTLSVVVRRLMNVLIREGVYTSIEEVERIISDFSKMDRNDPAAHALIEKYGVPETVSRPTLRSAEIYNWVKTKVLR